ncbi:unnamed protein product [Blepharisma stoltei]|uniref:Ribosomal protein S19 n=1 Tax=Blepharisma stoltei TaxID=1481888 RepID=A0AAU9JPS2_9CILI|nr:unnamed protein product [Blepharisma stoltei]
MIKKTSLAPPWSRERIFGQQRRSFRISIHNSGSNPLWMGLIEAKDCLKQSIESKKWGNYSLFKQGANYH